MSKAYSPTSSLTSLSSAELSDEEDPKRDLSPYQNDPDARPSKRQRTGGASSWDTRGPGEAIPFVAPEDEYISEDTDGSVPGSPTHLAGPVVGQPPGAEDEFAPGEQVTYCKWDGCEAGNMGNMDRLVLHLNNDHIQAKQKKYSCEWMDCSRKGTPHASGYALRAHMRSHTREKPFYCTLPECDRSFTRSDALAKHMRTVHETEALRPSDPVPKHHSSNPSNKFQRIRLTLKPANGGPPSDKSAPASPSTVVGAPSSVTPSNAAEYDSNNVVYIEHAQTGEKIPQFPPDIQWTAEEASMSPKDLYHYLQRQLEWAGEDCEELKREIDQLEQQRREEWIAKELVLENAMEAEMAVARERFGIKGVRYDEATLEQMGADAQGTRELKLNGGTGATPWWRTNGKWANKPAAQETSKREDVEMSVAIAD